MGEPELKRENAETPKTKEFTLQRDPPKGYSIGDDRELITPNDQVLIVIEDDVSFAYVLREVARKKGYKCLIALTGQEGLNLAEKYKPKGITLDLKLPDMAGRQVLELLKANPLTCKIPVHVISFDSDEALSLQKGAIGHLIKPANTEKLEDALINIQRQSQNGLKKVLVVEDSYSEQFTISSIVKEKNIAVTIAERGEHALKLIQNESFDCVILDLQLPDITGLDILKKLSQIPRIQLPPVIVYTGRDLNKEEYQELHEYTSSFVLKGLQSKERLLDELDLFLHKIQSATKKSEPTPAELAQTVAVSTDKLKVLIVDDDLRNTFALSSVLKKKGLIVVLADNGKMALEKLEAEPDIQLVIMDIMMPIMDGYEAMQRIRAQKRYESLPIIALTAKILPEDKTKAFESGANDFLTKPVDVEKLLGLIKVWHSHALNTTQTK